jgi:hypothetical protein
MVGTVWPSAVGLMTAPKGLAARLQIAGKFRQLAPYLFGHFVDLFASILIKLLAILMQLIDVLAQIGKKLSKECHGITPVSVDWRDTVFSSPALSSTFGGSAPEGGRAARSWVSYQGHYPPCGRASSEAAIIMGTSNSFCPYPI